MKEMTPELLEALRAVSNEVQRAQATYGAFTSAHEGYAVLLEEMDELKAEVWKRKRNYEAMAREACQVAAMAIRLMIEIAGPQVVDEYRHVKKASQIPELPEPKRGATDKCKMCGDEIVFTCMSKYADPTWEHYGPNRPKHPATPVQYAIDVTDYNPTLF